MTAIEIQDIPASMLIVDPADGRILGQGSIDPVTLKGREPGTTIDQITTVGAQFQDHPTNIFDITADAIGQISACVGNYSIHLGAAPPQVCAEVKRWLNDPAKKLAAYPSDGPLIRDVQMDHVGFFMLFSITRKEYLKRTKKPRPLVMDDGEIGDDGPGIPIT